MLCFRWHKNEASVWNVVCGLDVITSNGIYLHVLYDKLSSPRVYGSIPKTSLQIPVTTMWHSRLNEGGTTYLTLVFRNKPRPQKRIYTHVFDNAANNLFWIYIGGLYRSLGFRNIS